MDAQEIRNRTISTLLAAFGAAATTATFLFMFQDSAEAIQLEKQHKKLTKEAILKASSETLNGPIARGIPKVGDEGLLYPDFIKGLMTLASNARAASSSGLGKHQRIT